MSCSSNLISAGIGVNCDFNTGGVKTVYVTELENVDTYTATAGEVTAITMVSTKKFYELKPSTKNTASFQEKANVNLETGSTYFTQTVTLQLARRQKEKRTVINTLLAGQKELAVIVLDQNGIYWFVGIVNGAQVSGVDGGSGTKKEDLNGYTITFEAMEPEQALEFDSALIAAIVA